jgi:protein gp37
LGTTVENQTWAEKRLPCLLRHAAARRFLSCEPLLSAIDLSRWIGGKREGEFTIDWVIAGGESGAHSRPMLPGWARGLRDQCRRAGIPFHFKQWGHWAPASAAQPSRNVAKFWDDVEGMDILMEAKGKKDAGRFLDGVTWDQVPVAA